LEGYYLKNFRPNPASPTRPIPSKNILAGSGTRRTTIAVFSLFDRRI